MKTFNKILLGGLATAIITPIAFISLVQLGAFDGPEMKLIRKQHAEIHERFAAEMKQRDKAFLPTDDRVASQVFKKHYVEVMGREPYESDSREISNR